MSDEIKVAPHTISFVKKYSSYPALAKKGASEGVDLSPFTIRSCFCGFSESTRAIGSPSTSLTAEQRSKGLDRARKRKNLEMIAIVGADVIFPEKSAKP